MAMSSVEGVSPLLGAADPRERLRGVRELARLSRDLSAEERERAAKLLAPLASDPEPFVRWNSALVAGLLGSGAALDFLEAASGDEHANTRLRVALALGVLGDPRGLPILDRYVEDPYKIGEHSAVRAFAALALGIMGDPAAIPALARLAQDPDPVVRWHAAVALGDIGDSGGLDALVALTADPVPFVRAHAGIGLAQVGDARGLEAVERLTKDEMPRVAQVATQALETLRRTLDAAAGSG